MDLELAALDPASQLRREREPVDAVLVVLLGVGREGEIGPLGAVEGDVSMTQELVDVAAMAREGGDADARGDR